MTDEVLDARLVRLIAVAPARPEKAFAIASSEMWRARRVEQEQAAEIERLKADNATLRSGATRASGELRHTYRPETRDWNLVARAIRLLEGVTTPDHSGSTLLDEKAQQVETIKALADALEVARKDLLWRAGGSSPVPRSAMERHLNTYDTALRLAGRLP